MKILFVTWDGSQTSYLESLFLPIFSELNKYGYEFYILQFTWANKSKLERQRLACEKLGFSYRSVNVWRQPISLGALLTSIKGIWHIRKAIKDFNIDIVMPRSTQPALSVLLALSGKNKKPWIFDADGLPLDERIDFSSKSPTSLMLRFLRDVERQAVIKANHVITRSRAAINILEARAGAGINKEKFTVVSNGRDESVFSINSFTNRNKIRESLCISEDTPLIIYVGSLGHQYCIDEMFTILKLIRQRESNAKLLVLTGSPELLHRKLEQFPSLKRFILCKSVEPNDVPQYLASADLGLALRKPSFSMQGVAPIKLSEYLLCGLPVIATGGIGDTDMITDEVGYITSIMDYNELNMAADWFCFKFSDKSFDREKIRNIGLERFSLNITAKQYLEALRSL